MHGSTKVKKIAFRLDTESFLFSPWCTWYNCCPFVWSLGTLHHWIARKFDLMLEITVICKPAEFYSETAVLKLTNYFCFIYFTTEADS